MGATPAAEDLLLGRYELGPLVGLGGTAKVFRAWDHAGGDTVAAKVFPAGSATSGGGGSREQEVLTGLRHAGLIEVRDSGVDRDGCPFVVMDFVEGESLAAQLRRGPLPVGVVVDMGAVLAAALAHVHGHGIVHRDIKPGNVLLDGAGRAWLADFGIARIIDATRVTATGVVIGTAAYMAPEQVRGEAVGPAADVYALGLVLLEAVTGRREYEGGAVESAMARLHRNPRVGSDIPDPLATVVRRMTLAEPADRPKASHVAATLREPRSDGLAAAPASRRVVRRLVPVGAVALLATTALGGALLLSGGAAGGQTAGGARSDGGSAAATAASPGPSVAAAAPAGAAPVPVAEADPAGPLPAPAAPRSPASYPPAQAVTAQAALERAAGEQVDNRGQDDQNGNKGQDNNGDKGDGKTKDKGNKGNKGKGGDSAGKG